MHGLERSVFFRIKLLIREKFRAQKNHNTYFAFRVNHKSASGVKFHAKSATLHLTRPLVDALLRMSIKSA